MGIASTVIGVFVLSFSGLCLYAGVLGVRSSLKYRTLSITDGRAVESGELVGLEGTIIDQGRLTSPFTEQSCVGHKWIVERYTNNHDRGREWVTKRVRGDLQEFSIQTDDGTYVSVKPEGETAPRSDLRLGTSIVAHLKPGETPPERLQELMAEGKIDEHDDSIGSSLDEALGNDEYPLGTRRYRERALVDGDDIYVYGEAQRVGNGIELRDSAAVFAVSDSTDEEIAETQTGQAIVLFLTGLTALLFGVGILL